MLLVAAAGAQARDPVVRTVTVVADVSGSISADYGGDPGFNGFGSFGAYSGSWTWHQVTTTKYRRSGTANTVRTTTGSVTESSNMKYRNYQGPVEDSFGTGCESGSARDTDRKVTRSNDDADPPRANRRYKVVMGLDLTGHCNGKDHGYPAAAGLGHDHGEFTGICVFSCAFRPGELSTNRTEAKTHNSGLGQHTSRASSTATVRVTDSNRPRKVRNRLPDDF